jgi:PAS domain S-box-containing protein
MMPAESTTSEALAQSFAVDVAAKQDLAGALWASDSYFRLLVQNSSDLILVIGRGGVILHATPASDIILDRSPRELIGKKALSLVHPEDREHSRPALLDFLRTPGARTLLEVRVRHADGHWIHLEAHCRNLLTEPRVRGIVVNTRDITLRKAAEEEVQHQLRRLVGEVERSRQDLRSSYDRTLEGWVRAIDLRDRETKGHTERVTRLTVMLATKMGFSGEALAQIRRGALLHDIGKIAIPDEVLLKPSQLSEEEWTVMRLHPVYAYEFLLPMPHLQAALDIPHCHHEKWDGSGYPQGLKGMDIPLVARIFAIVDVWDALLSDRPYRPAWKREAALEHIRRGIGTHFDPEIVPTFLEMLAEMKAAGNP